MRLLLMDTINFVLPGKFEQVSLSVESKGICFGFQCITTLSD